MCMIVFKLALKGAESDAQWYKFESKAKGAA